MHDTTVIRSAAVVGCEGLQDLTIDGSGQLSAIVPSQQTPPSDKATRIIEANGDWISLGAIDLQINGALGLAFPELQESHLPILDKICRFLWQEGIDGFLPTLVTTSIDNIHRALGVIERYNQQPHTGPAARILGVHLEGPFLNSAKRGAHPEAYLRPLTIPQVDQVLGDYRQLVTLITLAPELDPTGEAVPYLRSLGITVSLGHSLATAAQAQAAYRQGASMVTHAFNAMPPLHHRKPGLLGAALTTPGVACGLIADGQHVCPTMLDLLLRSARGHSGTALPENLFLVSDALAPLGLPDGRYPWDTREIEVADGTARLADGTLAGTARGLLAGAQNLVNWELSSVEEAIALATVAPRQAMGLPQLSVGQPASLLRWRQVAGSQLTAQRL
ncbi:MAG: N-acetylglucosamine-6-phosphate deacetylase [Cyanobacteria bacterium P01_A01_bin.135]